MFQRHGSHLLLKQTVSLAEALGGLQLLLSQLDGRKLLVKSGTVAVLHFGLFHRAARRMPDSIFRNMFKLQFFRSSAPTEASWDHQPDADGDSPPFADTGEPRVKQVVWETVWEKVWERVRREGSRGRGPER